MKMNGKRKTVILTMLIMVLFTSGCVQSYGKKICLSPNDNIIGLSAIYYKNGLITLKFDDAYAKFEDEDYIDFIGFIRNGDQQIRDQLSVHIVCSDDHIYHGCDAVFDSAKLTACFNVDDINEDMKYFMIDYDDLQIGIDLEEMRYLEQYNISPVTVEKYGDHIYCPDYLFTDDKKANQSLKDFIEFQGGYTHEDIFIYEYEYYAPDNSGTAYAYGYANGAVVDYINYYAYSKRDAWDVPGFIRSPSSPAPDYELDPDTSDLIDPELLIPKVIMFLREDKDFMKYIRSNTFCGTYLLKYDLMSDSLYYEYPIENRYNANVDANTGEIINYD